MAVSVNQCLSLPALIILSGCTVHSVAEVLPTFTHNSLPPSPPSLPPSLPSPTSPPRSLAMQTGDYILSINGTSTEHLMHSEVTALLENSGNVVNLEISYEATPGELSVCINANM